MRETHFDHPSTHRVLHIASWVWLNIIVVLGKLHFIRLGVRTHFVVLLIVNSPFAPFPGIILVFGIRDFRVIFGIGNIYVLSGCPHRCTRHAGTNSRRVLLGAEVLILFDVGVHRTEQWIWSSHWGAIVRVDMTDTIPPMGSHERVAIGKSGQQG